ncbi:MAG TPA: EFR1 family ferrodoxin [Anaerovoracaceae bacterium]|nr:EFR1 family ferrodoxin [Anaerovoracaceae bacterium]
MKTIIYYFSGRGNSCRIAKDLSKKLGDSDAIYMKRTNDTNDTTANGSVDCIGIVSPVIDFGLPGYVKRYIKALKVGGRPYVFSVVTCGGMPCASMLQMKKLIKEKGLKLDAGFTVKFGPEPYSDREWKELLDGMALAISSKTAVPPDKISFRDRALTALLNPIARSMIKGEDRKFKASGDCDGCGVCARVCPAGNIEIVSGRPEWKHKCEQCAACFAWCPEQAISGTNLAAKTKYRNPHVTLARFIE